MSLQVFNHMGNAGQGVGTAGSIYRANDLYYPGIGFFEEHFNAYCPMSTWDDVAVVRNCRLEGQFI